MTVTYCDITSDEIENATTNYAWRIRDRRYDVVLGRDISVAGLKKLDETIFAEMGNEERFSFAKYKQVLSEKLQDLTY